MTFVVYILGCVICDFVSFYLQVFLKNYLVIFENEKSLFRGLVGLGHQPLANHNRQGCNAY